MAEKESLKKAVSSLRRGWLVVVPTETVYGLGADPAQAEAIEKVYRLKGRDWRKQIPLAVHDPSWLAKWGVKLSREQKRVLAAFWPGPLTLVVDVRGSKLAGLAAVHKENVALRCPDHPLLQQLLSSLGKPLALTSANVSGKPEPVDCPSVDQAILDGVDVVLDGGPCLVAQASTVVSMIDGIEVLREGPVSEEDIVKAARSG